MNKWKVAAIILIIVCVLETSLIIWIYNYGTKLIEHEYECIYTICDGYGEYIYDDFEDVCYCYTDYELKKTKYMG